MGGCGFSPGGGFISGPPTPIASSASLAPDARAITPLLPGRADSGLRQCCIDRDLRADDAPRRLDKLWHLATAIPPVLAIGFWFVRHKSYRWTRMTAFVDPWSHPQKEGYHMIQSLLSFSTGGGTGRGIGNGIQKLGYPLRSTHPTSSSPSSAKPD